MSTVDGPTVDSVSAGPFSTERAALQLWSRRQWVLGIVGGFILSVVVSIPTDVIPNPFFTRSMAVTWWSYPVVISTGVLGALLVGSYVRNDELSSARDEQVERSSRFGLVGATLSFFAIGCPVCNKLVLLALGASGTMTWFAPVQPVLAIASVILMAIAVRMRLRNQVACAVPSSD
ncbi:MAG: hypothetical protein PSX37_06655 [bacterium]|nr:hypothetical protein [bacterium]